MLAAKIDADKGESVDQLAYPVLATVKIDGIRCLAVSGAAVARSLKLIPNRHVQRLFALNNRLDGLDGELITYTDGKQDNFNLVQSKIMTEDGCPDFKFHVFDDWSEPSLSYAARVNRAIDATSGVEWATCLVPKFVNNRQELDAALEQAIAAGYEGVMVRKPDGPYKYNRATFKQGYLVKVKPFEDAEAVVVDLIEGQHNDNEATINALGHTERSSHKANMVPNGKLGALVCQNEKLWPGVTFNVGTGFTDAERRSIWADRQSYVGKTVTFRYQAIGVLDRPRIPAFKGFRCSIDT